MKRKFYFTFSETEKKKKSFFMNEKKGKKKKDLSRFNLFAFSIKIRSLGSNLFLAFSLYFKPYILSLFSLSLHKPKVANNLAKEESFSCHFPG